MRKIWIAAFVILLGFCLYSSFYIVKEGHRALVWYMGEWIKDPVSKKVLLMRPGIHFKWPLIMQARIFDMRTQIWEIKAEQGDVSVNYAVMWRISDPVKYTLRTEGNATQAQTLFEEGLNKVIRSYTGQKGLGQILQDPDRNTFIAQLTKSTAQLGISVLDLRLKAVDLPPEVVTTLYSRMRAQCERIAAAVRVQGKENAEEIKRDADTKAAITLATAKANALQIRADADAEAGTLYAQAYARDPGFYAFYRSLAAYKRIFASKQDWIVIKPEGQFFKYFNSLSAGEDLKLAH